VYTTTCVGNGTARQCSLATRDLRKEAVQPPREHVAIVILTNVRNGSSKEQVPFNAAVKRRIPEELFSGARPVAEQQLGSPGRGGPGAVLAGCFRAAQARFADPSE
jgi:hypothetical protein